MIDSKSRFKEILSLSLVFLYVLVSGYAVLNHEYIDGNFYFYFFQSSLVDVFSHYFDDDFVKTWYSNFNKIIFPLHFWIITVGFSIAQNCLTKISFTLSEFSAIFRYAFIFHLYLLITTYSTELVPNFAIMPGNVPTTGLIDWYRSFFIGTALSAYYYFCLCQLKKLFDEGLQWFQLTLLISPLVLVFLAPNEMHFISFCLAFSVWAFSIGVHYRLNRYSGSANLNLSKYGIFIVFAFGLFFRIKYAGLFSSSGEALMIFSADGHTYYNSAKSFFENALESVDFYQAPLYSYYLSWFLWLLGPEPSSVYYAQAVIGSALPLIVYQFVKKIGFPEAALITAILVATDPLCIHYSVAINRSSLLILAFSLLLTFCLILEKKIIPSRVFAFGSLIATTLYVGQETLPILLGILGFSIYRLIKNNSIKNLQITAFFILGFAFIATPINLIHHSFKEKWIWLGRDAQAAHSPSFFYNPSPPVKRMIERGFNPIDQPKKSLDLLVENPLTILSLTFKKLWMELPGFLFDSEAVYFAPIHLSVESFYGAHIQFYIYFYLISGILCLLKNPLLPRRHKILILGSIVCHGIMISIFIFGASRFRAPIVPLNLILSGLGVWKVFFQKISPSFSPKYLLISPECSGVLARLKEKNSYFLIIGFLPLLGLGLNYFLLKKFTVHQLDYFVSDWYTRKTKYIFKPSSTVGINSNVIAIVHTEGRTNNQKLKISIPVCNFLIPGERPYYALSIDDEFMGAPQLIPRGCSKIQADFSFRKRTEILYFYFYYSADGKPQLLTLGDLFLEFKGQRIAAKFFRNLIPEGQKDLVRKVRLFQAFSRGGLVLGRAKIEGP